MGNKVHKHRTSKLFSAPRGSKASVSVTIPSVCTSPSFHLSLKKSTSTTSSEQFNWTQMKTLYTKQEFLTINHLTPPILKMTAGVFEVLKRQMSDLICDLYSGVLKMPEAVADRWGLKAKSSQIMQQSMTTLQKADGSRKMMIHLVKMLYMHDLILNLFGHGQIEEALDLVKQVAVSHALLGVACTEFRMMDWFIVHYLIKNKLTSDENINSFLTYLNTLSNYIALFYDSQSVRQNMKQKLVHDEKRSHRHNKARENFRLMKKWKKRVETFKEQENVADLLLSEQIGLLQKEEDMQSIDTLTLKKNDFIMKHFVKKSEQEELVDTKRLSDERKKKTAINSFR